MDISRVLRIVIGAGIIAGGLATGETWWFVGLIPLASGVFNTCGTASCSVDNSRLRNVQESKQDKITN